MAAIAGTVFFLAVLAVAASVIWFTLAPRLDRIAFLLRYGPVLGAELPPQPRVLLRGRSMPLRVAAPQRLRLAA
jgi:hypothetical protein